MIYRSKETVCSITVPRDPEYLALVQDILEHPLVRSMEAYTQHGETSCLRHSINVSYLSYLYCRDHGWQARAAGSAGDGRGRTRIFNREKKRQNSVDVIHAVLFLCGDGGERPIAEI